MSTSRDQERVNVVITTMPKYKNDVLIEHKDQCESIVNTVNVTKDAMLLGTRGGFKCVKVSHGYVTSQTHDYLFIVVIACGCIQK